MEEKATSKLRPRVEREREFYPPSRCIIIFQSEWERGERLLKLKRTFSPLMKYFCHLTIKISGKKEMKNFKRERNLKVNIFFIKVRGR